MARLNRVLVDAIKSMRGRDDSGHDAHSQNGAAFKPFVLGGDVYQRRVQIQEECAALICEGFTEQVSSARPRLACAAPAPAHARNARRTSPSAE